MKSLNIKGISHHTLDFELPMSHPRWGSNPQPSELQKSVLTTALSSHGEQNEFAATIAEFVPPMADTQN